MDTKSKAVSRACPVWSQAKENRSAAVLFSGHPAPSCHTAPKDDLLPCAREGCRVSFLVFSLLATQWRRKGTRPTRLAKKESTSLAQANGNRREVVDAWKDGRLGAKKKTSYRVVDNTCRYRHDPSHTQSFSSTAVGERSAVPRHQKSLTQMEIEGRACDDSHREGARSRNDIAGVSSDPERVISTRDGQGEKNTDPARDLAEFVPPLHLASSKDD